MHKKIIKIYLHIVFTAKKKYAIIRTVIKSTGILVWKREEIV